MQQNVESVVRQRIQLCKLVQGPKGRQNERVIDGLRRGPDFLQAEWANNARILRQMRFIIPNEGRPKNLSVRNENKSN